MVLSAALSFTAVSGAQANPEFERRIDMIEALEETHDDVALNQLIREDDWLSSYSVVLYRAAHHHKSPELVHKLLNMEAIDKASPRFKQTVASLYASISLRPSNEQYIEILDMLLDEISDSPTHTTMALSMIFEEVSRNYSTDASAYAASRLLENGADLDRATLLYENAAEAEIMRQQETLGRLRGFKQEVTSSPRAPGLP